MKCKKCNLEIDDKSLFCSYCGERVEKENAYVDPFQEYRQDTSHNAQYQYQQEYSDQKKKNDFSVARESSLLPSKFCIGFGVLFFLLSFLTCFVHFGIAIAFSAIAICLMVCGFRQSKKKTHGRSVAISIFSTIMVLIVSITILFLSLPVHLMNGMTYTMKEYLTSIFFNSFYSDRVYGMWMSPSKEVLDLTSGFYYNFYNSKGELIVEGTYLKVDGHDVGGEDFIYSDHDFYFFDFVDHRDELAQGRIMVLCLDKNDFSHMVLYFPDDNSSVEMKRITKLPQNYSSSSSKQEVAPGIVG